MLNKKFFLQHTVDVYLSERDDQKVQITFHRMTTREKIEIITSKPIAEFLALLNGQKTVYEILNKLGSFNINDAKNFISFLESYHLITEEKNDNNDTRYTRQIAYFDDMVFDRSGYDTQDILSKKKIVIIGCGAVTGYIAETLVRAGILNFTLIDNKKFTNTNLDRHLFARKSDVGKAKVEVLANYLQKINSKTNLTIFQEKLLPHSDLSKWIENDTNLVINGCDEPYIGHTSVKLGRYLQTKNIPLYVMGGFDAHLMSSGELVFPPKTPCIDCIQQTFSNVLSNWKPTYINIDDTTSLLQYSNHNELDNSLNEPFNNHKLGASGGLACMSCFSASLSSLRIIHFLTEDSAFDFSTFRYEYLLNEGEMTRFELLKQGECNVCCQQS